MRKRLQIRITGIVQGVGLRPHLFALAAKHAVAGRVLNDGHGVSLEVEGETGALENFLAECRTAPPPLARIEAIACEDAGAPTGLTRFVIAESPHDGQHKFTLLSPDVATCADCLRELFDPHDRRFQYPFINCTNCGPRFTIIEDMPYDRARTTMSAFPMCVDCACEYHDPRSRRFHAQPNACAACGPTIRAAGFSRQTVQCRERARPVASETRASHSLRSLTLPALSQANSKTELQTDAIEHAAEWLRRGDIVAIKGIGGYHLACDALNDEAVRRLRERKVREDKPFALMAASVEAIRQFCVVSEAEARLLQSPARPIVLLRKLPATAVSISQAVALRQHYLGFMLPYAPLHHLLLARLAGPLVMTSGNVSDEPIAYHDDDAMERLKRIADHFLIHDREIHTRCDDSVARLFRGRPMVLRRSRGYAPEPIKTRRGFARQILACGAELKNTFCLTRDNYAFLSHHIGDLENAETLRSFTEGIEHFTRLFYLRPEVIAYDLHPEYLSTKYALSLSDNFLKIGVQHHHAHIISCLADNDALDGDEPVIGVAFDGMGYGADGALWGGEFLLATPTHFERVAHLQYQPLPGGARAVREPWRMAAVFLRDACGDDFAALEIPFVRRIEQQNWRVLKQMIAAGFNCPPTSSMGRLFDAVASLTGVRDETRYEGQAAIELEMLAEAGGADGAGYEFAHDEDVIKSAPVIQAIITDILHQVPPSAIAAKFHGAVAGLIVNVARRLRAERGMHRVALSGGVFQNLLLLEQTVGLLEADGFQVFTHSRVPPNDGGISLGQAVIADALIRAGKF